MINYKQEIEKLKEEIKEKWKEKWLISKESKVWWTKMVDEAVNETLKQALTSEINWLEEVFGNEFDEREEFDRIVKQRIKELKGALE